jgi:DNA repair exonuclease SbcCD ATPase subunit
MISEPNIVDIPRSDGTIAHRTQGVKVFTIKEYVRTYCHVCGRTLTDEVSITRHIGPECIQKVSDDYILKIQKKYGVGSLEELYKNEAEAREARKIRQGKEGPLKGTTLTKEQTEILRKQTENMEKTAQQIEQLEREIKALDEKKANDKALEKLSVEERERQKRMEEKPFFSFNDLRRSAQPKGEEKSIHKGPSKYKPHQSEFEQLGLKRKGEMDKIDKIVAQAEEEIKTPAPSPSRPVEQKPKKVDIDKLRKEHEAELRAKSELTNKQSKPSEITQQINKMKKETAEAETRVKAKEQIIKPTPKKVDSTFNDIDKAIADAKKLLKK